MARIKRIATASAPVNIAVVKYWGKKDTKLILPTNDSLSVTLDQDHLRSLTSSAAVEVEQQEQEQQQGESVAASPSKDRLWLNGVEEEIGSEGRLRTCIDQLRDARRKVEGEDGGVEKIAHLPLHIVSENNFPTAAGLASSASGFAALVWSISSLYQLNSDSGGHLSTSALSRVARQGSGSACRSLFGGFVAWQGGEAKDGSDSLALQVAERQHWKDLHAIICVISDAKKGTPSTAGMQRTVQTSAALQSRISHVVPERMQRITSAIKQRDFDAFAKETMRDSNNFHATCLDTSPPIFYLNDTSRLVIQLVEELNRSSEQAAAGAGAIAAYTFDAGPNAVLYAPEKNVPLLLSLIRHYFPNADFDDPFKLLPSLPQDGLTSADLPSTFNKSVIPVSEAGAVRRLIHTRVGDGPRILGAGSSSTDDAHLIGQDALPIRLQRVKRV
ncbi:Mevalonate pyrophosphate decarboxylase [Ceraceosorus bombacis]|uniref:Diphosphomevalonate decarboxylase n=1 Tax=Ceraceosorus bombacis TaxID=401625 RepID=A0A0P1BK58_9BASI|nr:Mevalonate pyrophosphate decarboxylase [Ceraceosorus bombacis]